MLDALFRPAGFDDLPGWRDDPMSAAFSAFRRSALRYREKPCADGRLGLKSSDLRPAFAAALTLPEALGDDAARSFFETHFRPCRIDAPGFVTAYYEPLVEARRTPGAGFEVPILAPPDDLVKLTDATRPDHLPAGLAFARRTGEGLVPYHDRAAIEGGALGERARPLAFVSSRVDAFFIHVQGAARLVLPGGEEMRVTYAAKSGHDFTGPGGLLVAMGEIAREQISMQAIRRWLADNPDRVDEILHRNRSYIFFREAPVADAALGPVAAAKVPLTPGRSIAVDRLLHTFGTPFFIAADDLASFGSAPFRRLMIAQDTGSAITGPARADLFAGSGETAGEMAGAVSHEAAFFALVPRALAGGWR